MTCGYCGSRNDESERRCARCGRRPGDTLTPSSTPVVNGATALRLQPVAQLHIQDEREESAEHAAPDFARAYQKPLFEDRKVLTFPQVAPPRSRVKNPDAPPRARKSRPVPEGQGKLELEVDYLPPAPAKPRQLGTTVEAMIVCEFPAATPLHRSIAAGVDSAMVVMGYGLFLGVFKLLGGEFAFTKTNLSMFGAMFLLIAFAYGLCFAMNATETAGMRVAGLRLVTFDGFPPDRRQRLTRFFGACLSRCIVLGLLWGLADEESLSWQDYISRTFPTPDDAESVIVRQG